MQSFQGVETVSGKYLENSSSFMEDNFKESDVTLDEAAKTAVVLSEAEPSTGFSGDADEQTTSSTINVRTQV